MGFMNFLETLAQAGEAFREAGQELTAEVESYKEKYQYASDEELFRYLKCGSHASRSACSLLLKDRGYSQEEIAGAIRRR